MDSITTAVQGKDRLANLTQVLHTVREQQVPKTVPTPFTKRWWSTHLGKTRKEVQQLARQAWRERGNPHLLIHQQYRKARNRNQDQIRKAKKEHWDAFLEDIDNDSIWNFSSYATRDPTDGGRTKIPHLQAAGPPGTTTHTTNNMEKSQILHQTFFLPAAAPIRLPSDYQYPPPAFAMPKLTKSLLRDTISALKRYKAQGPDGLPNEVYIECGEQLIPYLLPIYQATLELHFFPRQWQLSRTVVLRKPGKDDYTKPTSYLPIALQDCAGKNLSATIAHILVKQAEHHELISNSHFLGRSGCTTTDSVHYITSIVKNAWRKRHSQVYRQPDSFMK